MDHLIHLSSNQSYQQDKKHHHHPISTQKHNNKRLTQDQVRILEMSFQADKRLEPELKIQLANQLGVPPRQVAIWYQNKRARWRTQSLELDYNTLQVKLENALADKRRLEKQVVQLQGELRRAQEMVFALNNRGGGGGGGGSSGALAHHYYPLNESNYNLGHDQYYNPLNGSNCNSSSDEGGCSSNLHDQDNVNYEDLQLDELYACLVGDGSTWGS